MWPFCSLLFFLSFSLIAVATYGLSKSEEEQRKSMGESGETKYREIVRNAKENPCWRSAVSQLNSTCQKLTDTQQSRLAVAFANCHLEKSGRITYPCTNAMSIRACTGDMDSVAFQTYTEFFTHTRHICYFLQNELWQEKTESIISHLSETSSETVHKLKRLVYWLV